VYIRYLWQENHQICHIRCIYTVLANPTNIAVCVVVCFATKACGGLCLPQTVIDPGVEEKDTRLMKLLFVLCALQQRHVEDFVNHRRVDIRDSLKPMDRHKRKIRVTVTNTHANQQQVSLNHFHLTVGTNAKLAKVSAATYVHAHQ